MRGRITTVDDQWRLDMQTRAGQFKNRYLPPAPARLIDKTDRQIDEWSIFFFLMPSLNVHLRYFWTFPHRISWYMLAS